MKHMENTKTFRTKTGYCHVLEDKIILSREGTLGNVAEIAVGNNISQILIIYGIIAAVFIYMGIDSYTKHQILQALLMGIFALYMIFNIINSRNNSATPIIERRAIKAIKFKKGISGISRSRFEILFEDEKGKLKKRLILLPGAMDGTDETEKAMSIFRDEKLIKI